MIHHHLIRVMLLTGIALLPCTAQEESVVLQFLSFPKAIDSKPVELLIGDQKTLSVEIPSNELSVTYKVNRQAVWAVGESATGEDGKPTFKVFGKAPSLAAPKQLILLIRKGENYSDGMDLIPINNDIKDFGGGKFLFMNAAKIDIAGEAGGEKFVIKPSTHTIVTPKPGENGRTFQAMFYFRKDNEAKPFFSSKWPVGESARALIFFYHDPETNHLRLHSIRDFL